MFSLKYYFDAVYCDVHDALVRCWKKIVDAYMAGKITEEEFNYYSHEMGKPLTWTQDGKTYTFTLEYAIEINEKMRDPSFASQMQAIWRQAAQERYDRIYNEVPDP